MATVLQPYPAYKEFDMAGLAAIPDHWDILRTKYVFREVDERSTTGNETHLSMSQTQGLVESSAIEKWRLQSESYAGGKLCKENDLVLNRLKAHLGVFAYAPRDGLVSPDYTVFRSIRSDEVRFFELLFKTPMYKAELRRSTKGIVEGFWRLYTDDFYKLRVPVPPEQEQRSILAWLDRIDRSILQFVRNKRRLIELLNEQKQAIVNRAVTHGLDPTVPLRPSGIEWLDDIPAHWKVLPLKAVCEVQSGIALGKDYRGQKLSEYPYLRVANVQAGHTNLAVVKTIWVPKDEALRSTLQEGDVLMTEGGDPDKLGRGCVWDGQIAPCLHQNHVFAVRPNQARLLPQFLSALTDTRYARAYFESTAKQTTNLAATNRNTIGQFKALLPPVDEQKRILVAIYDETYPMNTAISRLKHEIGLIREYRTRLVADVVTGQLDVRHFNLLEAEDEPLSLGGMSDDVDELAGDDLLDDDELAEVAL